jgi:TatD DNase family protein
MLVDSHCHLNFPDFKDDLDDVIIRAQQNGIEILLTINTKLTEATSLQQIAEQYEQVFYTVGVHPHEAQDYTSSDLKDQLKRLAMHPKVVGLGETGLDYYYQHSPREAQIFSFETHIEAGIDMNLPIIIHTREADADTLSCLKKYPKSRGVFHCFSGSSTLAQAALELGYYISFSGIITFKKAEELRQVVRDVPLNRILVETDAPYLAPVPHRGKRNEPAFTRYTAEMIADLKQVSFDDVAKQTTQNFFNLFNRATMSP